MLFVGVDATADSLRDASRRVLSKPSRGGLSNALFGRAALEELPGELVDFADGLSVLFPWGSLLRAVARPRIESLSKLRQVCKVGAALRVVFGYGDADAGTISGSSMPALTDPRHHRALEAAYRQAGFDATCRALNDAELGALDTTWAKKLAFSGRNRVFLEVRGVGLDR